MTPFLRCFAADVSPLRDAALYQSVYRSVSPLRREKADRMRFLSDRCLSIGAEALLMHACREIGTDCAALRMTVGENGKPAFADSEVCFNLSHSGERVMCAVSDRPVGCDVQRFGEARADLAKRFFSDEENRALDRLSPEEREDCFCRLWTLKESFMKCTGLGFALPLRAFTVTVGEEEPRVTQRVDEEEYQLFEADIRDGYHYAWCVKAPRKERPRYDRKIEWYTIGSDGKTVY